MIVNAANTATQIQRTAILAIFMGEITTGSDGKGIAPIDQSMRSPVRAAFSEKVLGKPAMSVQIHWLQRIAAEHVNPETVKVVKVVASGAGER